MENMKIENWCGHKIRFVEQNGEWYAILKDICDALGLRTAGVAQRLEPDMMIRVAVEGKRNRPAKYSNPRYGIILNDPVNFEEKENTFHMLAVNEIGIYEALFSSRKPEARKFRRWSANVMQKLRKLVGLEGYEAMHMTDPEYQEQIDHILDSLYWDEETGRLMMSITVQGGDTDQIPFEEY